MSNARSSLRARAISTFTSKGHRPGQEDYVLVDREKGIFVVADGFGGPVPGANASKLISESIRSFLFKEAGDLEATLPFVLRSYFSLPGNVLFNSLIFANRKLNTLNQTKNVHERGGASVIAGFIDGDLLAIANVGVCTAWLFRDDKFTELVVPRSFSKLCDPFSKSRKEELQVPLIAMGMSNDLEPEIVEYKIKQGDWIVFCTDGIPDDLYLKLEEIKKKQVDPDDSIEEVSAYLNRVSFLDNAAISLIIV